MTLALGNRVLTAVTEFRLAIGAANGTAANACGATVGVRCNDEALARFLAPWWEAFASSAEPDIWLELNLRHTMGLDEVRAAYATAEYRWHGDRALRAAPDIWRAEMAWETHTLEVMAEAALFDPSIRPRALDQMLTRVYNTACFLKGGSSPRLLHGCGVVVDGRGYLFIGPSGAGKSTVAALAGPRVVLNDEVVALRLEGDRVWLSGTPFLGDVNRRAAGWYPLRAVFVLAQAPQPALGALPKGVACARILGQAFDTMPIAVPHLGRDPALSLVDRLDLAASIARAVPAYELCFRPDESFWPLVEAL